MTKPESRREPSEMVRKVAIAISGAPFPSANSLAKARAAIQAMREPTEAMGCAGIRARSEMHGDHCAGNPSRWLMPEWRAMIDAALGAEQAEGER